LEILGDRRISIVRELTKIHEEALLMTIEQALSYFRDKQPKGEFVLVVEGADQTSPHRNFDEISIEEHLMEYVKSGLSKKEAIKQVAKDRDIPKSQVYPYSIGLDQE